VVHRERELRIGAQVQDLAACTYADPARFYSYRRSTHRGETDYGRHLNAVSLTR